MTVKVRTGNFFEDFRIGAVFRHAAPRTLTEGDRSLHFGLTGSRWAIGSAETTATALGLPRRPLDDILVFNVVFGKTVTDVSLQARGNLGYADVRFLAPVYAGDTVSVESEVIGLKENSNGQSGVVYVRSVARNQHGETVLSYVRWVMINKREPGVPCPINEIPDLPESVAADDLNVSRYGPKVREIPALTGSEWLWDDYAIGERLNHPMGGTIYHSDQTIASRLYQNNARGHFDSVMMGGKPLVYGGHIISLCLAAAYDGLENALSVLAINGGAHVAPTFGDDTLRCASVVTGKIDLGSPHVGALRLRTVAAKNSFESAEIPFDTPENGKVKYTPGVVLDLDYTIAIPRRAA